ncbi:hypothetical protein N7522_006182 [Penicillium canescens]|nr:hypothetical protein N7522_006182 [Penicillium canescens]
MGFQENPYSLELWRDGNSPNLMADGVPGAFDGFGVDEQAVPVNLEKLGYLILPRFFRDGLHYSESTLSLQSDAAS